MRGRLRGIAVAALAVALCAPTMAGAARAGTCASGPVAEAMQLRALNSRLMVAALSCEAQGDYNAFVDRFDDVLSASGRRLADWFGGRGGQRALNDYVTGLANKASLDSLGDRYGFCAAAREIFAQTRELDAAGLIALSRARPRSEAETAKICL